MCIPFHSQFESRKSANEICRRARSVTGRRTSWRPRAWLPRAKPISINGVHSPTNYCGPALASCLAWAQRLLIVSCSLPTSACAHSRLMFGSSVCSPKNIFAVNERSPQGSYALSATLICRTRRATRSSILSIISERAHGLPGCSRNKIEPDVCSPAICDIIRRLDNGKLADLPIMRACSHGCGPLTEAGTNKKQNGRKPWSSCQ